ncbi:hypothetical protein OG871_39945 (plasmid) [Kitasatospora sp. NBC_00374]|uniref:hypothetical protein n=1 Tax=Kitasatospora sp. NBC_00374 TaxID=2975964 RepID=UPI002F9079DC
MSATEQSQPQQAQQPTPVQPALTTQQFAASVEAHVARVNLAVSDHQAGGPR